MRAPLGCVLLALTIAACSGGNSAIPSGPGGGAHGTVTVKFHVIVPTGRTRGKHAHGLSAKLKHIWSIAQNTMGIQVVSYAHGDRSTPLGTVVADISPASASCSATSSAGGRTCNVDVAAAAGNDDFVATTYDRVPAGGKIPAGANQLGYGVATKTVSVGAATNVNLAIDGVLAQIQLAVTPNVVHTLIPTTATLDVYALDADGDVIVGNGYIDANGNTVTVGLSVNNPLPMGSASPSPSPSPSLTLAQTSINAPHPAGIAVTYAPPASGFAPAPATVTIAASPSASSVTATSATLTASAPTANSIHAANLSAGNSYHGGIAFDNAATVSSTANSVYFTSPNGFGAINQCTQCAPSSAITSSAGTSTAPLHGGITGNGAPLSGSSQIYAVAGNSAELITTGPVQHPIAVSAKAAPIPNGSAMIYDGVRGLIWYASSSSIVSYPIAGTSSGSSTLIGAQTTGGLTLDSGDNVWLVDTQRNRLIVCTAPTTCGIPIPLGGGPFDIADETNTVGAERIVVTDRTNNTLRIFNTSGAAVNTLSLPKGASPAYVTKDNSQPGILWFDYLYSNGSIGLARLDMNLSPPQFLMVNGPVGVTTSSASPQAGAIGLSPSGQIYTVFDADSTLVQWLR